MAGKDVRLPAPPIPFGPPPVTDGDYGVWPPEPEPLPSKVHGKTKGGGTKS